MDCNRIIQINNLSKKYFVGHERGSHGTYGSFRDAITTRIKNVGRKALDMARGRQLVHGDEVEEFWALSNVSFDIANGEVVGIIGRNGAGKSTLLKILSRITEPTEGRVQINGRVASLLEVGTGFHPELTGRENIFLNGAILGMTKEEIKGKFDEIVTFAEVERFLDTPVKHYSSGMYVRLAFAVAAHLEPEILIVDEVLAVGDSEFQAKCLSKMDDTTKGGRTVLFVSHNMQAVQTLCKKVVLLEHGRLSAIGGATEIVSSYLNSLAQTNAVTDRALGPSLVLKRLSMLPETVPSGSGGQLTIELSANKETILRCIQVLIYSELGVRVGILDLRRVGISNIRVDRDISIKVDVRSYPLVEGRYILGLYIFDADHMNDYHDLAVLRIIQSPGRYRFVPSPVQYRGTIEFEFNGTLASPPDNYPSLDAPTIRK